MKKNRKRKIIVGFVLLSFLTVKAQNSVTNVVAKFKPYHDVRLTLGSQRYEIILPLLFEGWNDIDKPYSFNFNPDTYYAGAVYTTGSISASYIYQISKKFGFGATVSYCSYYNNLLDAETTGIVGKSVRNHVGVFPKMYFTWMSRPTFSIYSSLGLGVGGVFKNNTVGAEKTPNTYWNITGQYTLIGFTVGRKVYATGEILGYGTEGIVKVGVGYRFNSFKKAVKL